MFIFSASIEVEKMNIVNYQFHLCQRLFATR